MADDYVDYPVLSTEEDLADLAIDRLQTQWPDWDPEDPDLAIIQIEALAPLAQNAAEAASVVPAAAFRAFGTKLIGEPYDPGTVAVVELTFTMVDNAGYTVDAGFEVDIDGFIFRTVEAAVVPALSTSVSGIEAHASFETSDANGLEGDLVTPQTELAYVESVSVDAPSSGGTDAQDDDDYQNDLVKALLLQGKTLVTLRDYELWALDKAGIGRAVAVADVPTRTMRVTVINDTDGLAVSGPIKTALAADYEANRLTNWVASVVDADYWVIVASVTVKAYPGFTEDQLTAAIRAALDEYLSPFGYAASNQFADPGKLWLNDPIVRRNKVIDLIGNVPGVDYVLSAGFDSTTTKAVTATASSDVFHRVAHGLKAGYAVQFTGLTGGAGITPGQNYYVIASGLADDDFKVSASPGGGSIDVVTNLTAGVFVPSYAGSATPVLQVGDLAMPGRAPLPTPGVHTVIFA